MNEIKSYITKNDCYKSNRKRTENRGVLIHSTATPGATPEAFVKSWNTAKPNGSQVCVHAFSDDKKVINTLPYDMRCWGCGSGPLGSGNNWYIQIEMCEPADVYFTDGWKYNSKNIEKTSKYIKDMVEVTAEWAALRLKELGISVVNKTTVTSHYEGNAGGFASNHSDPKGLLGLAGLTMDDFRDRVTFYLNAMNKPNSDIEENSDETLNNQSETLKNQKIDIGDEVRLTSDAVQYNGKAIKASYMNKVYKVSDIKGDRAVLTIDNIVIYAVNTKHLLNIKPQVEAFKPYLVRVTASALNIRTGPGTSYPVYDTIKDKGVYTIVDVEGSWGKLKSGAGWISLNYTSKL